nr:hypothetical protein [Bradyrhizobium sp. MOS002]
MRSRAFAGFAPALATFASALRSLHGLRQRWHQRGSRFYCDLLNHSVFASARLHGLEHGSPFDRDHPAAALTLNQAIRKNV